MRGNMLSDMSDTRIFPCGRLLRALFLIACFGFFSLAVSREADAGRDSGTDQQKSLLFDIPAQPLHEALFAYTDATGLSVLVDDSVATGRQSMQVKGRYTPENALKIMLGGTGLEIRYTAANAFTLVPGVGSVVRPTPRAAGRDEVYFRTIQTAVKHLLCSRAETVPGQYRIVLQLWIDASGVVLRSVLLGSTGNRDRDRALPEMLAGLSMGDAPPIGLPQPVTLVVLPRSPDLTEDCGSSFDKTSAKAKD